VYVPTGSTFARTKALRTSSSVPGPAVTSGTIPIMFIVGEGIP
jgi:hypothetical protein